MWDSETENKLLEMKRAGMSHSACANALKMTRSAIAGKSLRLARPTEKIKKEIHNHKVDVFISNDNNRKTFAEVSRKECHWIYNDDLLCAKPVADKRPYCQYHSDISYTKSVSKSVERVFVEPGRKFE